MKSMDYLFKRIQAMENAKQQKAKKMELVYDEDDYWDKEWKTPAVSLTEEQKKQVDDFWGKYSFAYKNSHRIQEHYTDVSGRFDPCYCAPGLNSYYMYRFYDSPVYHTPFHDKNYREFLFKDTALTPAVVHRIRGLYYDEKYRPISYYAAISKLAKSVEKEDEKLIVKPTPGGGGDGIGFIRYGDTIDKIAAQLDSIKNDDVIIERFIKAHPSYEVANPTSLNSLRIITFLYENEVTVIAVVFRMGAQSKEVDNFSQGGVACGVTEDGICMDFGFDHFGKTYEAHPNGFEFAGHKLFGVDKAVELAKKLHWRVPQFKQMSWDIAINEEGIPTLIEMNPRGGVNIYQSMGALPFGERTPEIIDDYLFTLYYNVGANWDWDYKEYADHIVLTSYGWNKKCVKVPEQINGKPVTHIANGCFTGDKIRKIIVPGCVKTMEDPICAQGVNAQIVQLEDTRNIVIDAPSELKAKLGFGANIISWEPAEGATQYQISRMRQGGEREVLKSVSSLVTTYKDHNVLYGETYYYFVRTFNSGYNMFSEWIGPVAINASWEIPAPSSVRADRKNGRKVLSWESVPGATHYYIYRMKQGESRKFLQMVSGSATSFNDPNAEDGVVYHYYIRAHNYKHNILSDWSKAVAICNGKKSE